MNSKRAGTHTGHETAAQGKRAHDSRPRTFATLLVLVAFQLPLAGRLAPGTGLVAQIEREGVFWVLTLFLLAYVLLAERRPLLSIGLKWPTWKSVALGVAAAVVMIGGIAAIYTVVFPRFGLPVNESRTGVVKALPTWFRMALVTRAAVFEELYYRGFAIERLTELAGSRWAAALISLAGFTLAHLGYWGWPHLIVAAFGGAVLTALYLFRQDLASNMIAHFVTDGVGFLLA